MGGWVLCIVNRLMLHWGGESFTCGVSSVPHVRKNVLELRGDYALSKRRAERVPWKSCTLSIAFESSRCQVISHRISIMNWRK